MTHPLTEKYRPQTLDAVLGNSEVIIVLQSIMKCKFLPHMLFYGPPGTGKTTTIRALAYYMYNTYYTTSVLELNASDERGIDTVRDTIKNFSTTLSFNGKKKLIILDEADSMSRDAQNAMRRIIEDYSHNVRFCLIANYASKIIPAIHSRCTKFRFSPVKDNEMYKKIEDVLQRENVKYDNEGINALMHLADGDMRKLMNDIEGVINCFGVVSVDGVNSVCGTTDHKVFCELYEHLCTQEFDVCLQKAIEMKRLYSIDCETLILQLSELVVNSELKQKMKILKEMSDLQYRLSIGCNENIQLRALISTFLLCR
ncbi:Replication factor C (RF-C) subunit [Binucleata daphniae]